MSFFEFEIKVFTLFAQKKYQEALETAALAEDHDPEMKYKTSYWKACIYSQLGNPNLAIHELSMAMEDGIWWNMDRLLKDEDLT